MTKNITEIIPKVDGFCTTFEPKFQNRYIIYINKIPSFILKSTDRPKVEKIKNFFGIKKWKWIPICIEAYDPIIPSGAQAFMKCIDNPELFEISIKLFGPVGDIVEEWLLIDSEFISVDFGNLNWENAGMPVKIKAEIKYKSAKLIF